MDAVEALAAALDASNVGFLRAALEMAARHITEAAPGTPQADAAQVFLQESGRIRDRHRWAGALQFDEAPAHQEPDWLVAMRDQVAVTRALADEIRQENRRIAEQQAERLAALKELSRSQQLEAV